MALIPLFRALVVNESSQVAEARRAAISMAAQTGLDGTQVGKVSLITMELGTNLVQHGGGGSLWLRASDSTSERDGARKVEIVAVDQGPGMADVEACFADGFSSRGTLGVGLGAVRRLASAFDVYSRLGEGTAIWARVSCGPGQAAQQERLDGWAVPLNGEAECGDAWMKAEAGERTTVMVSDGLGHGPYAAKASAEALAVFAERPFAPPAEVLRRAHANLRATRGAALAVAEIDRQAGQVKFAGLGNISGAIVGDYTTRQMVSHNGTAGLSFSRAQEFTYPWTPGDLVVLHSDGLKSHWKLDAHSSSDLRQRHPALIAAVLVRDYGRGRDDVTVVVGR